MKHKKLNWLQRSIHNYLVRLLTDKKGGIEERNVNTEKRTIYVGLYGLGAIFMSPKSELAGGLLVNFFKYQCIQLEYEIRLNNNW